jgi:hypothetical protein
VNLVKVLGAQKLHTLRAQWNLYNQAYLSVLRSIYLREERERGGKHGDVRQLRPPWSYYQGRGTCARSGLIVAGHFKYAHRYQKMDSQQLYMRGIGKVPALRRLHL